MATGAQTLAARARLSSTIATSTGVGPDRSVAVEGESELCLLELDDPFLGRAVEFSDGSKWELVEALSQIKLQQIYSPCEATQVFTARCFEDLLKNYGEDFEAVIKVKFQVGAPSETIRSYKDYVEECDKELREDPEDEHTTSELKKAQTGLQLCTEATDEPNVDTVNEILALQRLAKRRCASAPWLGNFAISTLPSEIIESGLTGGYLIFTLMTKLPGSHLSHDHLCKLSLNEREDIRVQFKEALSDVYRTGVIPTDTRLSNILWDQEARQCYLVDFEHCRLSNDDDVAMTFKDSQYRYWGLHESYYEC